MSSLFSEHTFLIFFLYGLSLFVLGFAAALGSGRRRPFRLSAALPYLAGFGIVHAGTAWIEMVSLATSTNLVGQYDPGALVVKGAMVAISGALLMAFGLRLLLGRRAMPFQRGIPLALLVLWLLATTVHAAIGQPMETWAVLSPVWARYLLIAPSALVASAGLIANRRPSRKTANKALTTAAVVGAVAFAIFAVIAGLAVPPLDFPPANEFNYALLSSALGTPVQVLRGAAAMTIALSLVAYMRVFRLLHGIELAELEEGKAEADQRTTAAEHALREQAEARAQELELLYSVARPFDTGQDTRMALQLALERVVRGVPGVCGGVLFMRRGSWSGTNGNDLVSVAAGLEWEEIEAAHRAALQAAPSVNGPPQAGNGHQDPGQLSAHAVAFALPDAPPVDGAGGSVKRGLIIPLGSGDESPGCLAVATTGPIEAIPQQLVRTVGTEIALAFENRLLREEAARQALVEQASLSTSDLLFNVSHELRTPLATIKAYATALMRRHTGPEDGALREYLGVVDEEADRLNGLVGDLLDLARLESRTLALERGRVRLDEVAREAWEEARAVSQGHAVEVIATDSLPPVQGDRNRLRQVLRNLLENAVRYSPDGGRVQVRVYPEGLGVVCAVEDQGIGIEAQNLDRVFDKFFRETNEATIRTGGCGLGLAICKGIVEAHGGRIWVESEKGKGSTFYVALPQAGSNGKQSDDGDR